MSALPLMIGAMLVMICCTDALAADAAAQDARFARPFDKDHPANFAANFADRVAWEKRADFLRHQALVALGLWPMPVKTPLNAVIHSPIDRDEYTVEKVFFASMPGHYVSGNLYRPKNRAGKLPAVLCPYGHWPGGRFIWNGQEKIDKEMSSGAEQMREGAQTPLQARCAMLARMGCVVFHYDMVGVADSNKIKHQEGFTDAEAILRLQSFMGLQTWNSIRAMDFVASLPEVDPDRIAVTGASGGATQTIVLEIVDPRVAVAFPAVMVSMNMQGGCVCENAPLYRVGTNNVELAALFAPRPQGCSAAQDWTHDFEARGLPEMKAIYRLFGAEDQIEGKFFPFPHNYNQHSREMMYAFMNKHLKLPGAPVKEKPFVPVPPADLSVYDAQHPVPSDAADAAALRQYMTRASDEQMKALANDREEYYKVLGVALQAMVVDSMPAAGDVEVIESSGPLPLSSAGEWIGLIARKGSGERIPGKAIFPADWDGGVVIWSDPEGCANLNSNDPAARKILAKRQAVIAIDTFMSGSFKSSAHPVTKPTSAPAYAAFTIGYNRSVAANRVHDLLTVIALVKGWDKTRALRLAAFGEAGPTAWLARVLAGDSIDRAVIDMNHFDFDSIKTDTDPMLLPGGLKYGGIYGFVPLCNGGPTMLFNARPGKDRKRPAANSRVILEPAGRDRATMIDWLLQQN